MFGSILLILVILATVEVFAKVSASQVKLQIPMPTKTGVPFSLSIPIISGVAG
uniref:Secreted protein n=1 Tax=Haemonchus contortus TaxID=6289 RepID=A0A912MGH6_HAECO